MWGAHGTQVRNTINALLRIESRAVFESGKGQKLICQIKIFHWPNFPVYFSPI